MEYLEIILANGKSVIAIDSPESYIKACLNGTEATCKVTSEQRAKEINHYYRVNGGSDYDKLRLQAMEAKLEKNNKTSMTKNKIKVKVIELKSNGCIGYLAGKTCFDKNAIVEDINKAYHYTDDEKIKEDLSHLYITDVGGAMSGVRADSASIVEFEIETKITELSRKTI